MKPLWAVAAGLLGAACVGQPEGACNGEATDPYRELLVVDDGLLSPRGVSASELPWSPARLLAASGSGAWLARGVERWRDAALLDGKSGVAEALDADVLCRWLQAEPANACDASCSTCAAREFDEALAPFRALAVVNRTDLRLLPDARSPAGEGRVVLGLTPAPGRETPAIGLTLIFEFALWGGAEEWAGRWHELRDLDDAGGSRRLGRIVEDFASQAPPDGRPALSQLRVSIRVDDAASELRELAPDAAGELALRGLRNTPRSELDGSPELAALAREQAARITNGTHVVPADMLATAQGYGSHAWALGPVDAELRTLFDRGTCAGCHANDGTDGGFHVSPYVTGRRGLSRFLSDPSADDDELGRREREHHAALCGADLRL